MACQRQRYLWDIHGRPFCWGLFFQLKVLAENPQRWTKVYALSRKPPGGAWPAHFQHIPVDFLGGSDIIAKVLKEHQVKPDVVFFYAYIQPSPQEGGTIWSNVNDLVTINKALLNNFLDALSSADAVPSRILLQLGAKYCGVHLGPTAVPQEEDDPRVTLEPNFYYHQEDALMQFARDHDIGWNTTRPASIPGAVTDAAMNLCLPLAIYATVKKHLGQPIEYPSDIVAWEMTEQLSSAQMNSYLAEWAVLTPEARNQSFNSSDGSAFSWGKFWPKFAHWFNLDYRRPETQPSVQYREVKTPYDPPPRGFGPPAVLRTRFTLAEWAKRPEVQKAWSEIAEKYNLRNNELGDTDRIFGFTDNSLMWSYPSNFSSSKLRKYGFHGYVDTSESIHEVFKEFVELRMIPPF
nr:hypothetical protein FVER53263_09975 [Fusarium verticillioides]